MGLNGLVEGLKKGGKDNNKWGIMMSFSFSPHKSTYVCTSTTVGRVLHKCVVCTMYNVQYIDGFFLRESTSVKR